MAVVEAGSGFAQSYLLHPRRAKNGLVFGAALCNQVLCGTGYKKGAEITGLSNKAKLSYGIRGSGKVGNPLTMTTARDSRRTSQKDDSVQK
ncbi:hypothetical protein TNCT_734311 [Trichonephila clavata]|uniref:Uncharacterized protein n=1 Tax=Trichonephila clavata TaxID=2740835 RepID=A0A8X6HJ79_TRICU|nr:hypothetical protein TNCT_734311 [Trichonephila clavata]